LSDEGLDELLALVDGTGGQGEDIFFVEKHLYEKTGSDLIALAAFQDCIEKRIRPPAWLMEAVMALAVRGVPLQEIRRVRDESRDVTYYCFVELAKNRSDLEGDVYARAQSLLLEKHGIDRDVDTIKKGARRYRERRNKPGRLLEVLGSSWLKEK